MNNQDNASGASTLSPAKLWSILAVVLAADVMDLLDGTITNLAAPLISQTLGGGQVLLQWLGTSYALAMGVFLVVGGRLGDKYGQRKLFLIGIAGFTTASLACGLAVNSTMLIVSRLLQGAFGALLIPQGMAIMTANFPRDMRAKAFSVFGPTMGVAAVLGPILAGYLIHADLGNTGWRSMFLINLVLGSIGFFAAWKTLPKDRGDSSIVLDGPGSGLLGGTMMFLLCGLIAGANNGWSHIAAAEIILGLVCFGLFGWRQTVAKNPLIKPSLLKNRGFTSGLILALVFFAVVNGLCYVISLYLQTGLGSSPFTASLQMTPLMIGIIIASVVGSMLIKKLGKKLIAIGLAVTAAGAFYFIQLLRPVGAINPWGLFPAILVVGFGMGLCFGTLFDVVIGDIAPDEAGSASGSLSAVQQLAGSIGSAVITTVFFAAEKAAGNAVAMQRSLVIVIATMAICFAMVWLLPSKVGDSHPQ